MKMTRKFTDLIVKSFVLFKNTNLPIHKTYMKRNEMIMNCIYNVEIAINKKIPN